MGSAARRPSCTYAQYLEFERTSELRHEFIDGEILAMSGGTPLHAFLIARVLTALGNQLGTGPCRTYSSDLRIRVPETGRATYADVTVICGEVETHPEDPDAATNPTVIVEVLSPTTERDDRGEKFAQYRHLLSLRDYVLVSQERQRIEHYARGDGGRWTFIEAGPGGRIALSIGVVLEADAVYPPGSVV
jgi:Uma2 family endonuclease